MTALSPIFTPMNGYLSMLTPLARISFSILLVGYPNITYSKNMQFLPMWLVPYILQVSWTYESRDCPCMSCPLAFSVSTMYTPHHIDAFPAASPAMKISFLIVSYIIFSLAISDSSSLTTCSCWPLSPAFILFANSSMSSLIFFR